MKFFEDSKNNKLPVKKEPTELSSSRVVKPTFKRHIILFLFCVNCGNKAFQWIQVSTTTKKLTYYYETDNFLINTTAILFSVNFILLSVPLCSLIKLIGLRKAVVLGSLGTALGSIIKCFGLRDQLGISMLFIGQILVSISEQFVVSIPSRLVAVWYPDDETSLALSICFMGNTLGIAIGFIIPEYFLVGAETVEQIGDALYCMFIATALFSVIAFIADYLLFDEAPEHPPGLARLKKIEEEYEQQSNSKSSTQILWVNVVSETSSVMQQIVKLLSDRHLAALNLSYAISYGISCAMAPLIDQMIVPYWPDDSILVVYVGVITVLVGSLTLPVIGLILDAKRKYLLSNKLLSLGAGLSTLMFGYCITDSKSKIAIYIVSSLLGIFQLGIETAALELAVELSYPKPELIISTSMNLSCQMWTVLITYLGSYITDGFGTITVTWFFFALQIFAFALLFTIRETLRRQSAALDGDDSESSLNRRTVPIITVSGDNLDIAHTLHDQ